MAAAIADLLAALKAWQSAIQQFKQQGKSRRIFLLATVTVMRKTS